MEELIPYVQKNIAPLMPLVFMLTAVSQLLITLATKLFSRKKVTVYPAGMIELALNQHGATLSLSGSLHIKGGEALITRIEAVVTSAADNVARTFEWRAFKPYFINLIQHDTAPQHLEPVAAFMLSPTAMFKYNLVFVDDHFVSHYSTEAERIQRLWLQQQQPDMATFLAQPELRVLQQQFLKDVGWQTGDYTLTLRMTGQNKTYEQRFKFHVTSAQINTLQNSFEQLVHFVCQQPNQFGSVRCAYA